MLVKVLAEMRCIQFSGYAASKITGGSDLYIPLNDSVRSQIGPSSVNLGLNPANKNNVVTQAIVTLPLTGTDKTSDEEEAEALARIAESVAQLRMIEKLRRGKIK